MKTRGPKRTIYTLLAGALFLIVLPIGVVAAAPGPQAKAKPGVKKQLKQLKKQLGALEQQLDQVADKPGPPNGAAGGDLQGTYPNPLIAPDAIGAPEIALDSVGSDELKGVTAVVGQGVTVNAGTPQNASVTCPVGQALIGAGYAWQDDEANSIIASAPDEADPNQTWVVRGMVAAGSNTLFAWANCMQV